MTERVPLILEAVPLGEAEARAIVFAALHRNTGPSLAGPSAEHAEGFEAFIEARLIGLEARITALEAKGTTHEQSDRDR